MIFSKNEMPNAPQPAVDPLAFMPFQASLALVLSKAFEQTPPCEPLRFTRSVYRSALGGFMETSIEKRVKDGFARQE